METILVVDLLKGGQAITHTVPLTNPGMERIQAILTWSNIRPTALANVRDYFIANPADISPSELLKQDILLKAGGIIAAAGK